MDSRLTCKSGRLVALSLAALLAAAPPTAFAEDAASAEDADAPQDFEEVVVTAHALSGDGLSEAAVVLQGEALQRDLADNIGATIARQAGIHNASFGEAVGRPVVHGMGGPRVRVMEDRIDAMDASITSGDHAVAIEPFLANQVEVLKGPSTLLYGSGAIGGVVGIHTGRVPHTMPEGMDGRATVRAGDNGRRSNVGFRLDGGGRFAWHVDGFTRSAGEYDIPGFAESGRFRAAEEAEEEEEHHEHGEEGEDHDEHEDEAHEDEETFGHLPGSQADGQGGAIGFSWIGERGFVGASVSRLNYDYGLPGGAHAHHHEEEEEHHDEEEGHDDEHEVDHEEEHEDEHDHEEEVEGDVTLDLEQTRFDFEGAVEDPFAGLSALNFRFASNDYAHTEIEPSGEVGTRFAVDSYEGRIELAQTDDIGVDGVGGVQFARRSFSAIGEEAFVPPVDTSSVGAFLATEYDFDAFDLESGVRMERVKHEPEHGSDASFTAMSASLGAVVPTGNALFGIHGGYSARAPAAEELYSNGPHLATNSFEVGDPTLDVESAWHGSATLAWADDRASITATAYATAFRDHIYTYTTGDVEDGLPVIRYGQADASLRGLDLAGSVTVAEHAVGHVALTFMADTVTASVDVTGNDRLPRLPPTRIGIGARIAHRCYSADVDFVRVFQQDETADFELPTDAYNDLRLHLSATYNVGGGTLRAFLQGRNLTDEEQRHHTSIIKDLAPAPGRTLIVGLEMAF